MSSKCPVDPFTENNSPSSYRGCQDCAMQLPPNPYWPETPRQQGPFPNMSSFCQNLPSVGEAPGSSTPYYPAQTPTPTPQNPHPTRQPRAARTPLLTPVAQHGLYYGPPEPLYPSFYSIGGAPVPQVVGNESQGQLERFEQIPDLKKPFHTVALSEEMPIGSHVHTRQAPRWGVIKISNIPYSVTKYEISQFVGRQARLITPDKGCSVHIIMERSTAKTMDCFAETETHEAARETVKRINSIYESGRAPRLGLRRVEVELSNQDALLRELFPKAKCISWEDGMPSEISSTDPYSTGFSGFITSEEIVGAIRHAEIPHRSPFSVKCPQRTYESTISTLYKFPWYATKLYTVDDRNQLFEMANRHLLSLASRIDKTHTMGLDQNLLRDLLYAGLNCPAFNERQKYTLCVNSGLEAEIARFPEISKWFPFDTLVQLPNYNKDALLYYSDLISKGTIPDHGIPHLTNTFPQDRNDLRSPYGRVWFEWPGTITKTVLWESAVQIEMHILGNLVLTGWVSKNNETRAAAKPSSSTRQRARETTVHSITIPDEGPIQQSSSRLDIFATPSRHAAEVRASCDPETEASPSRRPFNDSDESPWTRRLLIFPPGPAREGFHFGHRTTKSSPSHFPGSST